ncbi:hypothetical protein [Halorussus ruber]|uniref:hypothetical protein n=1 Tax=Halorussus ruber TaxID=1126238 RepID=UPI001091B58D|nr:hypothetical protein [Halorussus ruber]
MAIEDRLRGDPEPVSPEEVLRYWLRQEVGDEENPPNPDRLATEPALRQELLERIPIAERVRETDDVEKLEAESSEDIREIVDFADEIEESGPEGKLVVLREGADPAYVADGNHRATAYVLYLLRGGEFEGQEVYLGVRE